MIDIHQNLRVLPRLLRCKLLELHVFVFILLSDDNGFRSASFSSSVFFLTLHKVGLFCFNNDLATLKKKQESGFGFSYCNTPKFLRESTSAL